MTIEFDMVEYSLREGSSVTVSVSVSPSHLVLDTPVVVKVDNAGSDDHTITPAQLTFSSSDTTADLIITAPLDTVTETFTITLTSDNSEIQFTPTSANVTITDASEAQYHQQYGLKILLPTFIFL